VFEKHFLIGNGLNNKERIKKVKSPVLIIHGDRDQVVHFRNSLKLLESLKVKSLSESLELNGKVKTGQMGKVKFVQLIGAGHNDIDFAYENELLTALRMFFRGE
jgi:fermentation-respiration switch protein FrsA (DUF1100 family)